MTIEFTIPGRVTSANEVKTPLSFLKPGGKKPFTRMVKSKSAREDTERIKGLALAAKMRSGWKVPKTAALEIYAFNSRLDVGNIEKTVGDSIKAGLLIVDDRPSCLESLFVQHMPKDHRGERYIVRVRAIAEALPL